MNWNLFLQSVLGFSLGTLLWPVLEYFLHRFLGHDLDLKTKFKVEHIRHHAEGNFFAPLPLKILAALFAVALLEAILFLMGLGFVFSVAMGVGLIANYVRYERFHFSIHDQVPSNEREMRLVKHHLFHHYGNYHCNFGVTTLFFDKVFGTYREPKPVKISSRLAPQWLKDNQERFSAEFKVV